jgi:hypothetical protein
MTPPLYLTCTHPLASPDAHNDSPSSFGTHHLFERQKSRALLPTNSSLINIPSFHFFPSPVAHRIASTNRPLQPEEYNWEAHYPEFFAANRAKAAGDATKEAKPLVRFADVGCGFGGLLVRLSPLFPDQLAVGGGDAGRERGEPPAPLFYTVPPCAHCRRDFVVFSVSLLG